MPNGFHSQFFFIHPQINFVYKCTNIIFKNTNIRKLIKFKFIKFIARTYEIFFLISSAELSRFNLKYGFPPPPIIEKVLVARVVVIISIRADTIGAYKYYAIKVYSTVERLCVI